MSVQASACVAHPSARRDTRPLQALLQPIYRMNGVMVAEEVLVRPVGYVGGAEAYYTGLASAPAAFRLDREMASLRVAMAAAMRPGSKAINVSLPLLLSDAGQDAILDLLNRRRSVLGEITLELLEYDAAPVDALAEVTARLVAQDARIALDDFGRGHAPLAMLSGLPFVHQIKFDASLVHGCRRDLVLPALADAVRAIGATSVAEHVDSAETLLAMLRCRVDCVQGFHLGSPQMVIV